MGNDLIRDISNMIMAFERDNENAQLRADITLGLITAKNKGLDQKTIRALEDHFNQICNN